ncbi:hypothetical protein [Geosporobacter ferrireducens]|nr:hypothetical protein [Geosporobacter ferrireducens]
MDELYRLYWRKISDGYRLAFDILNVDREKAVRKFIEYIDKDNDGKCLEIKESRQIKDNDAIKIIKAHCKVKQGLDLQMVDTDKKDRYIKELKEGYGLSIRQIERLTGVSRGIIQKRSVTVTPSPCH